MDKELAKRLDRVVQEQERTNHLLEALVKRAVAPVEPRLSKPPGKGPSRLYAGLGAERE